MPRRCVRYCITVVAALLATIPMSAWRQAPPPPLPTAPVIVDPNLGAYGTGAITGVITDGMTGQPIQGALVTLTITSRSGPAPRPRQQTDSRGRFIFTRLPAFDQYTVVASRQGYFDGRYKESTSHGAPAPIQVREGEWIAGADITLWKPASISGTVFDERGEPVVGIPVRALRSVWIAGHARPASLPTTLTDDRGVYRLSGLRPGEYVVHVPSVQITLPGGLAAAAGAPSTLPSGVNTTLALSDAATMMRIPDAGAGADLRLLVGRFPTPLPGSGASAYPMMYHPAERSLEHATPLSIEYGEQRTGVDVQLTLVPTVRVSGRVAGPADVLAALSVRLVPRGAERLGEGAEAAITITSALGEFSFLRVPEGDYTIIAASTQGTYWVGRPSWNLLPRAASLFVDHGMSGPAAGPGNVHFQTSSTKGPGALGTSSLSVGDRDIADVVVPLQTGVVVSGTYVWDSSPTPPPSVRTGPMIRLEPADGDLTLGMPSAEVNYAPGRAEISQSPMAFTISGVLPGQYVFGIGSGTRTFMPERIEYGGRNLIDTPLDIVGDRDVTGVVIHMTSRHASVSGQVTNGEGHPGHGVVLLFPATAASWRNYGLTSPRIAVLPLNSSGSFTATPVLPGEYFLAAIAETDRREWTDPDVLQTVSLAATRITVLPGAAVTQNLTLASGGR